MQCDYIKEIKFLSDIGNGVVTTAKTSLTDTDTDTRVQRVTRIMHVIEIVEKK